MSYGHLCLKTWMLQRVYRLVSTCEENTLMISKPGESVCIRVPLLIHHKACGRSVLKCLQKSTENNCNLQIMLAFNTVIEGFDSTHIFFTIFVEI